MSGCGIRRYVLARVWYVHPQTVLFLRGEPAAIVRTIKTAAQPSTQRLHLRNLFADGRRYFIGARPRGFRMTTTSKVIFRARRRTAATAILRGRFASFGDLTRLDLIARMTVGYLFSSLLVPSFMASLLVAMPWPPHLIAALIALLYGLSWFGHRYNARLQAHDMVWFVQKSLEDVIVSDIPSLDANQPDILEHQRDFEDEWERFLDHLKYQHTPEGHTPPDERS